MAATQTQVAVAAKLREFPVVRIDARRAAGWRSISANCGPTAIWSIFSSGATSRSATSRPSSARPGRFCSRC